MNVTIKSSAYGKLTLEEAQAAISDHNRRLAEMGETASRGRVERRHDGGYRAVFDHIVGGGGEVREELTCNQIAHLHCTVPADVWARLQAGLVVGDEGLATLRMVEPHLPRRWYVNWDHPLNKHGAAVVCRKAKGRAVTSHC